MHSSTSNTNRCTHIAIHTSLPHYYIHINTHRYITTYMSLYHCVHITTYTSLYVWIGCMYISRWVFVIVLILRCLYPGETAAMNSKCGYGIRSSDKLNIHLYCGKNIYFQRVKLVCMITWQLVLLTGVCACHT